MKEGRKKKMTTWQLISLTVFFGIILIAFFGIIIYDIWVYKKYGVDATISVAIRKLGYTAPLFAFAMGLFIGLLVGGLGVHFWWVSSMP